MVAPLKKVEMSKLEAVSYAQMLYEMKGVSLVKIAQSMGITRKTVTKWRDKHKWLEKGKEIQKVTSLTRDKFMNHLSDLGMPPEKAAKLLVEGMTKPMQDQVIGTDKDGKATTLYKGNKDYKARHKFHHDYLVMTGLLGNNKTLEVNNNGEGSVNIQVNLPSKGD